MLREKNIDLSSVNYGIPNIVIHLKAARGSIYVYQNIGSSIQMYICTFIIKFVFM